MHSFYKYTKFHSLHISYKHVGLKLLFICVLLNSVLLGVSIALISSSVHWDSRHHEPSSASLPCEL